MTQSNNSTKKKSTIIIVNKIKSNYNFILTFKTPQK